MPTITEHMEAKRAEAERKAKRKIYSAERYQQIKKKKLKARIKSEKAKAKRLDAKEQAQAIAKARLIPVWIGVTKKIYNKPNAYKFTPYRVTGLFG